MQSFYGTKTDAAQYAADTILNSKPDSLLTMIIELGSSEDCSVRIATDMSSEDIVRILGQACYSKLTSI